MAKARLRWSHEEKNAAVKLHANGLSAKEIGALLGRSDIAIANMLSEIRTGK
jgi:transposase